MVQSENFVQFQIFIWDFDGNFKPVVFEAEELGNWDMSRVIAVLPLFIKQDCESDVTVKSTSFRIGKCAPSWKLSVDTSMEKAAGRDDDLRIWKSKHVNKSSSFRLFWSKWIPLQGTKSKVLDVNIATKFKNCRSSYWKKKSNQSFWTNTSLKIDLSWHQKNYWRFGTTTTWMRFWKK